MAAAKLRRCTPVDAAAIAAIYDPIVRDTTISFEEVPPGATEMERRIRAAGDAYPWLALEVDGAFAGYAYASPHKPRAAYRWSVDTSVYVAPTHHRRGVGTRLYRALLETLVAQGYATAYAGIALPNDASVALHRSAGFTPIGVYHRAGYKHGAWRDTIWLERALSEDAGEPREPSPVARVWVDTDVDLG